MMVCSDDEVNPIKISFPLINCINYRPKFFHICESDLVSLERELSKFRLGVARPIRELLQYRLHWCRSQ